MVDLKVIEINIEASREKCKEIINFMNDKPFMKDNLIFILSTLNSKIEALEGIISIQQKETTKLKKDINHLESVAYNYDAIEVLTDKLINRLSQ